jgi:TRAP-type C4-dicarboxylate transport system permease small subunit
VTGGGGARPASPVLAALLRGIDTLCSAGAVVAAVSAAALALILITEVVATSFLGWSQPWAVEYAIYLQCFVLFCGAGWTLRQGGHIRVAILLQALPPAAARVLDLVGTAFAIGMLGFASWALWQQLLRSFDFGSTSYYPMGTPLWIPQALLTLGVTLLLLGFAARLLRLLAGLRPDLGEGYGGGAE